MIPYLSFKKTRKFITPEMSPIRRRDVSGEWHSHKRTRGTFAECQNDFKLKEKYKPSSVCLRGFLCDSIFIM